MDLERYRRADTKIGRIRFAEWNGNEGYASFSTRLRGLPAPSGRLHHRLEPWTRLEVRSVRSLRTRLLARFEGLFTCEETAEGTRVTHRECFFFRPPVKWIMEPFLRAWLERDTREEVVRMKALLEEG